MASVITDDNIGALIGHIESRSKKELKRIGEQVVNIAQQLVVYRTGNLHNSIHVKVLKTRVKIIADAKSHSGDGSSYAYYVETGTGRGPAQPFLRPALLSITPDLIEAFKDWQF